ncbi:MAG: hypothetical protein ACJ79Y_02215, partial [Myxococcales bacterium]
MKRPVPKITRPTLVRVAPRPRLFRVLDQLARKNCILWIAAPAGSGKTTLVASWLAARHRPCLWYQMDPGDVDPAAFFYYLREAVDHFTGKPRHRLPLLTPEYAFGLPAYSQNFFAGVATCLPVDSAIVLDNYQELPDAAPLHCLLPEAISTLAGRIHVLVLSRFAPPAAFARLVAEGAVGFLDADEITLSDEETRAVARARVPGPFTTSAAAALRAQTGGWMAATVLLLEAPKRTLPPRRGAATSPHQVLFDYFAAEIFDHATPEARKLLLATSLLPEVSVAPAEALAGEPRAAEILSDLVARNFFTVRLEGDEPRYRYHPLFREFLLSRARRSLDEQDWRALAGHAAEVVEAAGNLDEAATILIQMRHWEALARLVLTHAPDLSRHGRLASLERWIAALPAGRIDGDPWLTYWRGVCGVLDLPATRASFEASYRAFRSKGDVTGSLLAWAGFVSTFLFVWNEFGSLDPWISEMEDLRRLLPAFPSIEVECQVTGNMLACLMWRAPAHPQFRYWEDKAIELLGSDVAPEIVMELASFPIFHRVTWGDYPSALEIIDRVRPLLAAPDVRPLTQMFWYVVVASYEARVGASHACFEAVERGLEPAQRTGILGLNHLLAMQGVYGALAAGDLDTARRYHAKATEHLGPSQTGNRAHLLHLAAWIELCAGDIPRAEDYASRSRDDLLQAGVDLAPTWAGYTLAHVLIELGKHEEAAVLLDRALEWSRRVRSVFVEHDCLLSLAYARLSQGRETEALEWLRHGLRLGRSRSFVTHTWMGWRKDVLAKLCMLALERGIEPEHVGKIVKEGRLAAPQLLTARDNWPWPIRIRTLGAFELRLDGQVVAFGRKPPRKPLELLQAIAVLGGEGMREDALVDCLWPEAEGDDGQHAMETTLHRLRKVIGASGFVIQSGRTLHLDRKSCWDDVSALHLCLAAALTSPPGVEVASDRIQAQAHRILDLYRGPLLPAVDSAWAVEARDRLRSHVARCLR